MGLLDHNINLLWKVLFHKSFHLNQVKVRSTIDYENYVYQREHGWLEYVVQVEAKDPFPITFYYKDLVVVVSTLFSSLANGEGFDFGPTLISG
jgi:hypothetical protein